MRHLIIAAAVAAATVLAPTAAAAEPPMRATGVAREPMLAGIHDGAYFGITTGVNASAINVPDGPDWAELGLYGGAYLGWGIVTDGLYLGVEVDGMWRDLRPSVTDGVTTVTISNRWLASARARVGIPVGPALFYGTGGVAIQESVLKVDDPVLAGKDRNYVLGLVGGIGAEVRLTQTINLRVEGLHYRWADEMFEVSGATARIGQEDTVIRVGLGIKLN